ncbi:hypothetical protein RCOM_0708150 [Ricinus communis]|uniref:Uncharacterized protein n=1 Tax=Ricinus communis TaxID=3988 RepID=B9RR01_RICCO|nr:hypothetical protein RCOM_0708150 [Ricinus communis]|eukprot:XP_002516170.1 probable serine/threonine-protein kinase yakA [Ricinus communis]
MRGRSSKQETREGMEIDKLNKLKEEPHLSGAYIRSLVKQLTSSRTKDPMNSKDRSCVDDDSFSGQNMAKFGEGVSENQQTQQPQQPQQQHRKQVRRRLHTSRPYQERLLNMAEARREIVAALKFHRASMKQANEQQQQHHQQQEQQQQQHQQQSLSVQLSPPPCFEQEGKMKSRRNPRIYPSNTANFSNYLDSVSCTSFSHAPPPPSASPPPYPFCWPTPPVLPSTINENLNFPLPNQTLGLNLNFQDFNDLDTSLYHNSNNPSSVYSSSSPSSFSSPSPSFSIATEDVPSVAKSQEGMPPAICDLTESYGGGGLHQVVDDEEMAEMRSIGEQHQMEWNDTMNLVTSAWWFKFLKTMDSGHEVKTEDDGYQPFDEVMEFPSWLNANDACLQQHFDDYSTEDYYHDPSLRCMDIGEIEGMGGEWLS